MYPRRCETIKAKTPHIWYINTPGFRCTLCWNFFHVTLKKGSIVGEYFFGRLWRYNPSTFCQTLKSKGHKTFKKAVSCPTRKTVTKTNFLMLLRKILPVYSWKSYETHKVYVQNTQLLNAKAVDTCFKQSPLKTGCYNEGLNNVTHKCYLTVFKYWVPIMQ
jgi:hypothetical protein